MIKSSLLFHSFVSVMPYPSWYDDNGYKNFVDKEFQFICIFGIELNGGINSHWMVQVFNKINGGTLYLFNVKLYENINLISHILLFNRCLFLFD